jgi:PAS domain S-box-containing protein
MEKQRSAQLAAIVAASGDAIISIGTDLAVKTWNAGAQQLFGYGEAEAIGRSVVELTIPGPYEAEHAAIYAAAMSNRTAVSKETVRRHKDGRLLSVETNVSPILDRSGSVTGLSIILRDISERRRAEDALRRHAERQALLLEVTSDLIRAAEPGELSRLTFRRIGPVLGADICLNFRLDPESQHLRLPHRRARPQAAPESSFCAGYRARNPRTRHQCRKIWSALGGQRACRRLLGERRRYPHHDLDRTQWTCVSAEAARLRHHSYGSNGGAQRGRRGQT